MELAQSKVSQVETECHNQNLQHQLNSLVSKNVSQQSTSATHPWKVKWDSVVSNIPSTIPSFQSHIANQLNSFDDSK